MTEYSWWWGGTTVGDAAQASYGAPYTDATFTQALSYALVTNMSTMGVVYHTDSPYSGNLAVSLPGGDTARVAAGVALVNGRVYISTASKDITVSGGDGTYYIILQSDTANQVVRSTYGVSAVMVQNANYWEILLATVTKSGGVLTGVTDNRTFVNNGYTGGAASTQLTVIEEKYISDAGGGTFDFTGIPATYNNLKIEFVGRSIGSGGGLYSDSIRMTFNGDTGTNYDWYSWMWDRSLAVDVYTQQNGVAQMDIGLVPCADATASVPGMCTFTIYDYANSFWKRVVKCDYADTDLVGWGVGRDQGIWRNTANPISRVTMTTTNTDSNPNRYFAQYSRAILYGY